MATLLAHLKIKAGAEEKWEALIANLVDKTLAHEKDVLRYEYWKGQEPRTWYGLLSFKDKDAFFLHQDAEYHRDQPFGECIEDIRLEFLDPVSNASPLPRTANPPLPADAPENIREWEDQTPVQMADWWKDRN